MQTRMLGNGGLEVSAIALGCMRMSAGHGEVSGTKEEMIALLARRSRTGSHVLRHGAGIRSICE